MIDHYGALNEGQKKAHKAILKRHKVGAIRSLGNASPEDIKEAQELMKELQQEQLHAIDDRDAKIKEYKAKKEISSQLDQLRDYKDEDMKRAFYMAGIIQSVYTTFEQLRLIDMELKILEHRAGLTEE